MQDIPVDILKEPFPHLICYDFYDKEELDLIWEELNFYTKKDKLVDAKNYGGIVDKTKSKALWLDIIYGKDFRSVSNILTVNRKIFDKVVLELFSDIHDCCSIAKDSNFDATKVRYYHDGDAYEPHTDRTIQFLAFSYFFKEPKKFEGGELIFPKYDYTFDCPNNSLIMMPGWVEHGVTEVKINNSDYLDGYGRYAITSFFGNKEKDKKNKTE
tara:strand:+ start:136 stop:774 length:639 start_codon:yes stop_codon:yes gene_type:complete